MAVNGNPQNGRGKFHLDEPRAIVIAAVITGCFALIAAFIATNNGGGNSLPLPQITEDRDDGFASATPTNTPSPTPTETPTSTFTLTETPSLTPTPTSTLTHTPTLTKTETPTILPIFTSTYTPTPTNTPSVSPTYTLTTTSIQQNDLFTVEPTRSQIVRYPCSATVVSRDVSLLRVVRANPSTSAPLVRSIEPNAQITVTEEEEGNGKWYRITYIVDNSQVTGWIPDEYVILSDECY